ncbi:MAG: type II secretion system F family protein, partial [Armatimonadetes bacterium]|nr:type II secretion system F family protein [Armatimonadota bacterium]
SVYLRLAMAEVLPAIQAGESLTQNLALYPQLFPPEAIGLLRAAERSGDWEGICSELERWYSGIYRGLLWCIVSRIYYACVFALLLIVPYLPYIISRGARWYLVFALTHVLPVLGGVFLVWLAWRIAAGLPRSRPLRDRLVLAVPLARGLEMHNASARFLRALASLVHAGVAAADALELAGEATGNCVLAAQVKQAAEAVRRGSSVEEIALRLNFLDRQQRNVLATAFAAGRLDQGLTHLAAQASEAATSRAQFARLSIQGMLFLLAAVATGAALVIGYLNYLRSVAEAAGATDLLDELFKH